jgi:hypothetical protein
VRQSLQRFAAESMRFCRSRSSNVSSSS